MASILPCPDLTSQEVHREVRADLVDREVLVVPEDRVAVLAVQEDLEDLEAAMAAGQADLRRSP